MASLANMAKCSAPSKSFSDSVALIVITDPRHYSSSITIQVFAFSLGSPGKYNLIFLVVIHPTIGLLLAPLMLLRTPCNRRTIDRFVESASPLLCECCQLEQILGLWLICSPLDSGKHPNMCCALETHRHRQYLLDLFLQET